jgi:hypothetical protein
MADEETLRTLGVVLFPGFELLDVYGPLEAFGHLPEAFRIVQVAEHAGPIASAPGVRVVADAAMADAPKLDWLLIPGGIGTAARSTTRRSSTGSASVRDRRRVAASARERRSWRAPACLTAAGDDEQGRLRLGEVDWHQGELGPAGALGHTTAASPRRRACRPA